MSQGVMQMKSKFFIAVFLFVVFVLFAFVFGVFPMRFISMVQPNIVAGHSVAGNKAMSASPMLTHVSNVVTKVHLKAMNI